MLPAGHPCGRNNSDRGTEKPFHQAQETGTNGITRTASGPAVVREPLTPEHLADLDSARGEFLHVAGEAGLNYVHACSLDGSRWQDDPEAVRAITALIKEIHDADANTPAPEKPER